MQRGRFLTVPLFHFPFKNFDDDFTDTDFAGVFQALAHGFLTQFRQQFLGQSDVGASHGFLVGRGRLGFAFRSRISGRSGGGRKVGKSGGAYRLRQARDHGNPFLGIVEVFGELFSHQFYFPALAFDDGPGAAFMDAG